MKNITLLYEKVSSATTTMKVMNAAIQNLPADQLEILNFHFYDEIPVKEIAKKLNCSETTVYNKIKKAECSLRRQLNPAYYKKANEIMYGNLPGYVSL